jgi:hypothetical protein
LTDNKAASAFLAVVVLSAVVDVAVGDEEGQLEAAEGLEVDLVHEAATPGALAVL